MARKQTKRSRTNVVALKEEIARLKGIQETLRLALQSVTELYPRDPSAPGMCLAWLPDTKLFYASLLRYDGAHGTGKQVLLSVQEETLEGSITELVSGWINRTPATTMLQKRAKEGKNGDEEWERNDC